MKNEVMYEGKYIRVNKTKNWEWVQRNNCNGVVTIIPITDKDELIFVEQFRIPIGAPCMEFPAGLVGDVHEGEEASESAFRELVEETGYEAITLHTMGKFYSSPGLSDESTTMCVARNLVKVSEGGGDESEDITVHVVPMKNVLKWLEEQRALGKAISSNVPSGLCFAFLS